MILDAIDQKQQDELDANKRRDDEQQKQIDRLEWKNFWMSLLVAVNAVASLAQIIEAWCVYTRRGYP